jgi:hypothetical protein
MTLRSIARVAAGFVLAFVAGAAFAEAPAAKPTRILFVGNSLTYTLDTPARLAKLAKAMGRNVVAESQAYADFTLEDHWADGRALAEIRKGGWDVVVLQQASTADPGSLAKSVKQFAVPIREAGAKVAIFMPWAPSDRARAFPDAIAAHRAAAESSGATLIPVGEAWLRASSKDRRLKLYGDLVHQASLGSDLTVLTIYLTLFPAGPQEFTEEFVARAARALDIPTDRRDALSAAATLAIDEPMTLK